MKIPQTNGQHDLEEKLMQRLQRGDDTALNQLMDRWQTPLIAFLARYTRSREVAIDLAQETFVRIYEKRMNYRERHGFPGWMFAIASNLARDHFRWKQRHPTVSLDSDGTPDHEEWAAGSREPVSPTPVDQILAEERTNEVQKAIDALPHDLKTAILLFEYEDLSHQEIAGALNCTSKTVEMRLYRARKILKEKLAIDD